MSIAVSSYQQNTWPRSGLSCALSSIGRSSAQPPKNTKAQGRSSDGRPTTWCRREDCDVLGRTRHHVQRPSRGRPRRRILDSERIGRRDAGLPATHPTHTLRTEPAVRSPHTGPGSGTSRHQRSGPASSRRRTARYPTDPANLGCRSRSAEGSEARVLHGDDSRPRGYLRTLRHRRFRPAREIPRLGFGACQGGTVCAALDRTSSPDIDSASWIVKAGPATFTPSTHGPRDEETASSSVRKELRPRFILDIRTIRRTHHRESLQKVDGECGCWVGGGVEESCFVDIDL